VACKRYLSGKWKSTFRQNYRLTFSPTVPPFAARISRVVADVEAPGGGNRGRGGLGLHNKPIGCGASGAYAPGPVKE